MVPNPVHRVPPKGAQGAFLALDPVHRMPAKNGAQGAPKNPVHRVPLLIRCTGCHYGFAIRCTGCHPRYKPRLKSTLCTGFGDGLKNLSFCVTLPWKRDEDLPFFTGGFFCKHLTHWAGGQLFASRGAFAYKKTSLMPVKWPVKKWCFCRKRQMVKRVI